MTRGRARASGTAAAGRSHRVLLLLAALVLALLFVGLVPGEAAAQESGDRVEIVDAYQNESGSLVVVVQAKSNETVDTLQFRYENETDEVGPLTLGNGVVSAEFDDGSPYGGSGFNQSDGDHGMVRFVLNDSAPHSPNLLELNVSAYGTSYASADAANRSVLTANAYQVTLQNATGSQLSDPAPMLLYNSSSATLRGAAFTSGGAQSLHCGGVVSGDACVAPDDVDPTVYSAGRTRGESPQPLPTSLSAQAFRLQTANGTAQTALAVNETTTLRINRSTAPYFAETFTPSGGPSSFADEVRITNRTSGAVVYRWERVVSPQQPAFLSPKTPYKITFVNETQSETKRRYTTIPTKGITRQVFLISESNQPLPTSTVTGQVLNDSGEPVPNAVVAAERLNDPSPMLQTFNSSTTDENGTFSMRLPETDTTNFRYQFRIVSNETSGGTIEYFPTTENNDGNGYAVHETQTVVPTLELKQGGEVDISVTNASGGNVPAPVGIPSLSRTTDSTGERTRTALTESFSTFQLGPSQPTQALVRLPSPTTGPQSDVGYNVWGLDQSTDKVTHVCAAQIDVSQGRTTDSGCELETNGTLSIELTQYESIVDQTGRSRNLDVGQGGFYFRNVLVVRNASTGNVTTYLGPGSVQPFAAGGGAQTLDLPVPPGNYTVELRPSEQFQDRTTVRDTSNHTVTANNTTQVALDSGRDFFFEVDPERTERPFRRSKDNSIGFWVADPATEELLDDSNVSVAIQFKHLNGTVATDEQTLTYNAAGESFNTSTLNPADLGLESGLYVVDITITHENGTRTYNTTVRDGIEVSDFAVDVRPNQRVISPEETIQPDIRAFNLTADPPEGLNATAENISVAIYDQAGNKINETTVSEAGGERVKNGYGSAQIAAPTNVGQYRMSVLVERNNSQQGYATTWFRVARASVDVDVNQSVYRPTDPVEVTATVEDADGNPIGGATVETTVSGTSNSSVTNASDGEATLVLDPATVADGEWSGTTFVQVTATVQQDGEVTQLDSGAPIEVRAFDTRASAAQPRIQPEDNATINVLVPPGTNVDTSNVTVAALRGDENNVADSNYTVTDAGEYFRVEIDSSVLEPGPNGVLIEVTNNQGETAQDTTGVQVASLSLSVETDQFSYQPGGESVNVTAVARYPNGSVVENQPVTLTLNQVGDRLIQVDGNDSSVTTNSDGVATATLATGSDATGSHVVVAAAKGQKAYQPVRVSDVNATLVDSNGDQVDTYTVNASEEETVYVNVTDAAGNQINDGGIEAVVFVDGELIRLGEGDISSGTASVTFSVPSNASGTYPLGVNVRTPNGFDRATGAVEVSGSSAIELEANAEDRIYTPGDNGTFSATVSQGGSPLRNEPVEFVLVSDSVEREIGRTTTDAGGSATIEPTVPSDLTAGEYGLQVRLPNRGITASDGLLLTRINVDVESEEPAYAVGETVNLTVDVTNRTTGNNVSDVEGVVRLKLPGGGEKFEPFNETGTGPYDVNVTLPEDSELTGTQTIDVGVRSGSSINIDSTIIQVRNASENASLTVPEELTAGTEFETTANATVNSSATLSVYSPGTGSVVAERDLSIDKDNGTTSNVTLSSPGTYVIELDVPGVGSEVVVRNVDGTEDDPVLRVGPDLRTNATTFDTTERISIRTDSAEMSATIISANGTRTVALNQQSGDVYYGTFTAERPEGTYLVRLDGPNATDVDSQIIEVSDDA
ncbi:hypothetical protein [Halobellus ordinarius]|uniref:hypothetical protein n=1 Tax=Halobellus ordinarius TaxID=3075120 RepID=UPI0028809B42|nr:hypothetical protein [Halobellus sp. ZY16]